MENTNVYYHGTVSTFVPDILRDGLKPIVQHRWYATMHDWSTDKDFSASEPDGVVYLTSSIHTARFFATGKARYFAAHPNGVFRMQGVPFEKHMGAPVIPDAQPAILAITLPDNVINAFEIDPETVSGLGVRFYGSIEPQYIKLYTPTHHNPLHTPKG